MADTYTLPPLREEDKQHWYTEYYYMDQAPIDEELAQALAQPPMNPDDAILPGKNLEQLLDPERIKVKTGFCVLPNGGGYVAVHTKLPGITLEMYKRWNEWRQEEDATFRYKVWFPRGHINAADGWIVEDIGYGPFEVYFQQATTPENVGLDPQAVAASKLLMLDGAASQSRFCMDSMAEAPTSAIVCHLMYQGKDGIEMHSRFWHSYTLGENGLIFVPPARPMWEDRMRALAYHCAEEMANMRRILPAIIEHDKK